MSQSEFEPVEFHWAKTEEATETGVIAVGADGSLTITPDDDNYWGGAVISREVAFQLALTILQRAIATLPPASP